MHCRLIHTLSSYQMVNFVWDQSPHQHHRFRRDGLIGNASEAINYGIGLFEKIQALNLPWWHAWRVADKLGALPKRPVIFECVGVPGILQQIINGAPLFSKIVGVGVCMQSDQIEPALAVNKEIEIQFVMGYTPLEFRDALHMIALHTDTNPHNFRK